MSRAPVDKEESESIWLARVMNYKLAIKILKHLVAFVITGVHALRISKHLSNVLYYLENFLDTSESESDLNFLNFVRREAVGNNISNARYLRGRVPVNIAYRKI